MSLWTANCALSGWQTSSNSCIDSCRECGRQCCLEDFARNHCQNLPQRSIFAAIHARIHCNSVLLQTSRQEVAHANVAGVSSYNLFGGLRCNSAVYWYFTINWGWHKYSQMYLNTKYLSKSDWIANTKWKLLKY